MAEEKDEILEGVLLEFEKLAAIPRPSGHERAVSDFLKKYLTDLGFSVTQDEVCNIIADVPASKGFEKAPLTVLQGHMDMVCVAEVGRSYDPLKDAIYLKRTSEFLEACGTSLGADDGIGVAVAIYIARTAKEHGPIRLIFTVDEERGMTGAIHLADKYLAGVDYLINCDSENVDEVSTLLFVVKFLKKLSKERDVMRLRSKDFAADTLANALATGAAMLFARLP